LIAEEGRFGGYSLYLSNGHLVFCYNAVPPQIYKVYSKDAIPAGRHILSMEFISDARTFGAGWWITLKMDQTVVGHEHLAHTLSVADIEEGLDVGQDLISPVSDD
jgi:hypothetical protein